jgi:beta-galactosidase
MATSCRRQRTTSRSPSPVPATYMGGTQQLVADPSWTTYYQDAFSKANSNVIQGVPYAFFHSPGDPELNFEGGLQKIALRSTFAPGTVTVTASAPGLDERQCSR